MGGQPDKIGIGYAALQDSDATKAGRRANALWVYGQTIDVPVDSIFIDRGIPAGCLVRPELDELKRRARQLGETRRVAVLVLRLEDLAPDGAARNAIITEILDYGLHLFCAAGSRVTA
jgi:hypothetical protein